MAGLMNQTPTDESSSYINQTSIIDVYIKFAKK